jgi:hypothetical protein
VSAQHASNILVVVNEFLGSQDGSLGNAAVNFKTKCLLTSVDERPSVTTQVRLGNQLNAVSTTEKRLDKTDSNIE